jgi:hypothetical protein
MDATDTRPPQVQSTESISSSSAPSQSGSRWRRLVALLCVPLTVVVLLGLLFGMWRPADAAQAHANKATLDRELTHARGDLGVPEYMLAPITTQEAKVADGDGGIFYNYGDAATRYHSLDTQLTGIEQAAQTTLKQQAQTDLQAFATLLNQRRADGFLQVTLYQARYDDAQKAFATAKLPGDFVHVSGLANAGTFALQAMETTYDKLQGMQKLMQSLQTAGISTSVPQAFYDQDLQAFRAAASADDYQALAVTIDTQLMQLTVDQTAAQPFVAASLLKSFQTHIDQLKQFGDTVGVATFQQQYDTATKQFAAAKLPTDYAPIAQTLAQQDGAAALAVAKAKANQDFAVLQQLVDSVRGMTVINPADHRAYPLAYEYTSRAVGIGDASDNLKAAKTVAQYNATDFEITSLTACLKAMLANLKDTTPHNQAHQTDLQLLQVYNVKSGPAVVISLREQTARFYQDGKLVNWSYVTTGRPELPSVPGWHVAMARLSPTTFRSPDPAGSPNYYQPTHINFAVEYNTNGYFLHDAWWRSWFGPNSNLPHHDPAAFNGGSHGCVNFPLSSMKWVYNFTTRGTPIILY